MDKHIIAMAAHGPNFCFKCGNKIFCGVVCGSCFDKHGQEPEGAPVEYMKESTDSNVNLARLLLEKRPSVVDVFGDGSMLLGYMTENELEPAIAAAGLDYQQVMDDIGGASGTVSPGFVAIYPKAEMEQVMWMGEGDLLSQVDHIAKLHGHDYDAAITNLGI